MEYFNPVIIAALVIQGLISRISSFAGAIVGYLITTGILIWGISLYQAGDAIALFGIVLSKQVFIFACIFWYGADTYELLNRKENEEELLEEENSLEEKKPESIPDHKF